MSDVDAAPPVSVSGHGLFTPSITVAATIDGMRKVVYRHQAGGLSTELTSITTTDKPEVSMEKLNEIDSRLREVEKSVTRIDERIKHMPTTVMAWGMVAVLAAAVWAVVTFAGPGVVATAVKAQLIEHAEKTSTPLSTQ